MAQHETDNDPQRQMGGKEIAESLQRAQAAMNRYDLTRKRLAMRGQNPDGAPQLYDELVRLDSAVHDAYSKLRKYIKNEAKDEWWNTKILGFTDDERPIILGGPQAGEIEIDDDDYEVQQNVHPTQVKFIESYQGTVDEQVHEEWSRFDGWTEKRDVQPALMPAEAYRRAIQYMEEIRNEIGFSPEAKQPTNNTEITEEMIKEVEEWRKQNLQ